MISAVEARKLKDNICWIQLHQIEQGIKETIIMGGTQIGYKTDMLDKNTIEWLEILGYKVEDDGYNWTKISWEE
jgi:hypothetical protein